MPYVLTEFNDVPLPAGMAEDDFSTGEAESALIDSVNGAFDYFGDRVRLPRRRTITQRGIYVGETAYLVDDAGNYIVDESGNRIIAGSATAMLRAAVDAIKAQQGQRGPLWRRRDDGALQWARARLLRVDYPRTVEDAGRVAHVDCTFETLDAGWRAATATTTAASVSAGATAGLVVPNAGIVSVPDAVFSAAATSGTVTSVRVQGQGIDWTWTGSLTTGQTLTVDAGAQTVRRGSADAYGGFARASGHTAAGWLPLAPGDNVLLVTVAGGNANITVTHYDQFG